MFLFLYIILFINNEKKVRYINSGDDLFIQNVDI